MIDHFTKTEFENALKPLSAKVEIEHLGVVQGEHTYRIPFGNDHVKIELRSSVDSTGHSREDGEDSIRCWLVKNDGSPIGGKGAGKVQSHVNRRKGWQERMIAMIKKTARFGVWVQPCPVCGELLSLSVKRKEAYLYCKEDWQNKDNPHHEKHVELVKLDENAEQIPLSQKVKERDTPPCPKCGLAMVSNYIKFGDHKGKYCWTCPAKENGKWSNHVPFASMIVED